MNGVKWSLERKEKRERRRAKKKGRERNGAGREEEGKQIKGQRTEEKKKKERKETEGQERDGTQIFFIGEERSWRSSWQCPWWSKSQLSANKYEYFEGMIKELNSTELTLHIIHLRYYEFLGDATSPAILGCLEYFLPLLPLLPHWISIN